MYLHKNRCLWKILIILTITIFSNAGHKTILFGPRMVFCPSGFINFALPKNLCTYQVISNITYGVVNFPKTGARSSKPFRNFFWLLGNFFCQLGNSFGSDQFLPSNELLNITYGLVNFPKTGAKSSKPFGNFFWWLGNFFWRLGNFFGSNQFLPSNEL